VYPLLLIILDYLQALSLLLSLSFSHWPTSLLSPLRPLFVFNLDFAMLSQQSDQYHTFQPSKSAPSLPAAVLSLSLFYPCLAALSRFYSRRTTPRHSSCFAHDHAFGALSLVLLDLLILPLLLNAARLLQCSRTSEIAAVTFEIT
jgi:hypothetical protein